MINPLDPDFRNNPSSIACCEYPYLQDVSPGTAPAVSIITPYFNSDKTFLETKCSVLRQSCQNFEWIIADDGSIDPESIQQLVDTESSDNRVRIVRQKNSGPSAARNRAAACARAEYLCLLDSDDLLEPTFIEKCLWFLDANPEFAFCNAWTVNFGDEEFLWQTGFEQGVNHLKANSGPPIAVVRSSAFEAVGGFDESIRLGHEDWDFWLRLANAGYWGHTIAEYLAWYRKRSSGRFQKVLAAGDTHAEFEKLIGRRYSSLKDRFPAPKRQPTVPFPTVSVRSAFQNPLRHSSEDSHRILILAPWLVTGGADRVLLDWTQRLVAQNHQITLCTTLQSQNEWLPHAAALTPDVFDLSKFLSLQDYPRFILYLIESRNIDVVLIAGSTLGYLLLPLLRTHVKPGVAFIDLCHVAEPHWNNGGHPRFGQGYQALLDLNIVTTSALKQHMVEMGADAEGIQVCYTGIPCPSENPRAAIHVAVADSSSQNCLTILFAGRFCAQKRPDLLARILQRLHEMGIPFNARLVGNGELLERTRKELSGLSSVTFLGELPHHAWLEELEKADLLLLPSQYEGISIAVLEAMAHGVVPVSTSQGGQAEVVTQTCGVLVANDGNEEVNYVSAVVALLNDHQKLATMSDSAWRRAKDFFSYQVTDQQLLACLRQAKSSAKNIDKVIHPEFSIELATQAIEYTRLQGVADWLWNQHTQGLGGQSTDQSEASVGLVRLAILVSRSVLFQRLASINLVRRLGRWLIVRMREK